MKSILLLKDKTINMNFCIYNFDENEEKRKILLLQTRQSLSLPDYFLLEQRTIARLGVQPCPQGLLLDDFPLAMKTLGTRLTGVSEKNNLKCLVSYP